MGMCLWENINDGLSIATFEKHRKTLVPSPGDDVGAGSFWAFQWVNHRMFCRSHHIRTITGWWFTYPSEKYEYQPDYHGTIRTSRLSHQVIDNPGSPQILGYPIDNWTPSAPAECLFALVGYLAIKHSKRTFMKIPPYFENFPSSMSPNAPCMEYLPTFTSQVTEM